MIHSAFDHGVGARFAVFFQQVLFKRTCVHSDPDGTIVVARGLDDLLDALFIADVPRIDAQAGGPGLGRLDPAFVVKVDVGHDRHRALAHDLLKRGRAVLIGDRDPHDVDARIRSRLDLCERRLHIRRQRVGHGLDRDRRIAPHGDVAHHDLARFPAVDVAPRADVIERHVNLTEQFGPPLPIQARAALQRKAGYGATIRQGRIRMR